MSVECGWRQYRRVTSYLERMNQVRQVVGIEGQSISLGMELRETKRDLAFRN